MSRPAGVEASDVTEVVVAVAVEVVRVAVVEVGRVAAVEVGRVAVAERDRQMARSCQRHLGLKVHRMAAHRVANCTRYNARRTQDHRDSQS